MGNVFIAKKFDTCKSLSKKFDIYYKIVDSDVGNFVRHPDIVVLLHQFRMSNFRIFPSKFFTVYVLHPPSSLKPSIEHSIITLGYSCRQDGLDRPTNPLPPPCQVVKFAAFVYRLQMW
jgi:hypothetical protein